MANLNETVSAERVHIGFFGLRNAGKSSLVNAVTGQYRSVGSPVKGTTTDPVKKAMELLPLGPVVIIDTPGFDDLGELGERRIQKTNEILTRTDVAVLVLDATLGMTSDDEKLLDRIKARNIPFVIASNKCDLVWDRAALSPSWLPVSAKTGEGITALKERLAELGKIASPQRNIVADLTSEGDTVVLVIPIDESAPKGRLILPQQLTLRELLDHHAAAVCCQVEELGGVIESLRRPPRLVITDSQAFGRVSKIVPPGIVLTSFSILFARYKGELETLVAGAAALKRLRDGDRVLISEGCTHHRQCNDIGTVKLPGWITKYSGKQLEFAFSSGGSFPEDLTPFALIVHCGGCMLNEAAMQFRISSANAQNVPIVNYGIAIAQMHGILQRSLEPFPALRAIIDTAHNEN
jgi:[FeFe] hydrogenase H-cluster maturation GTPase HydF